MTWAFDMKTSDTAGAGEPSNWDKCTIGGVEWPGIVRVSVRASSGVDVKKPKGGKGAKIDDQGDPPLDVTIDVTLTPDELVGFKLAVVPLLRSPSKTGGRQPLELIHPMAAVWGISNILITDTDMSPPEPGGVMKVSVKAIQWVPQPAPVKTTNKVKKQDTNTRPAQASFEPSRFLTDPLYASRGPYEPPTVSQRQADGTTRETVIRPFDEDDLNEYFATGDVPT